MHKGKTYEECLGEAALEAVGKRRWGKRVTRALELVTGLLHPDRIYIGGGNARHIDFKLPPDIVVGSNDAGLEGGAKLWRMPPAKKAAARAR
jgi:polyphosphate glucokinase